jgi:predicted nucleotidyltransferase
MVTEAPTVEEVDTDRMSASLAQTTVEFALLFGSHARESASASSDVDIALRFPEEMDAHQRFRLRNRIDAELQQYTTSFVDVSDIDTLPTPVAYAALFDGIRLVGDEGKIEAYRENVEQEYEATKDDREQARREFINRLARGDSDPVTN